MHLNIGRVLALLQPKKRKVTALKEEVDVIFSSSSPSQTRELLLSLMPGPVTIEQIKNHDLCYSLLSRALPLIYASKPQDQSVTVEWLAKQFEVANIITLSRAGSHHNEAERLLYVWLIHIPGATESGLRENHLPSVFHGKYRSITHNLIHVFCALDNTLKMRAVA